MDLGMSTEKVETLVVGGGQAGLAMSEHLSNCGVPHLVLERDRIAERWRSEQMGLLWLLMVRPGMIDFLAWNSLMSILTPLLPKEQRCGLFRGLRRNDQGSHPLRCGGQGSA